MTRTPDAARDPRDGYTADEMNAMVRGETTPQELLEAGVGQDAAALDRSGDTEPASGTSAASDRRPGYLRYSVSFSVRDWPFRPWRWKRVRETRYVRFGRTP